MCHDTGYAMIRDKGSENPITFTWFRMFYNSVREIWETDIEMTREEVREEI